jgi:hypothetical protein
LYTVAKFMPKFSAFWFIFVRTTSSQLINRLVYWQNR